MKSLLIISILSLGIINAKAQEKGTSEIKLGYGTGSNIAIASIFVIPILDVVSLGTITTSNTTYYGNVYLSYGYSIADKWVVGADVVYERITIDDINKEDINFFTFAVMSNYNYISKPKFRLYSGLGLGYTTGQNKNTSAGAFNLHVNAIGARFGGKFAFHTELGVGYKGILAAGVSYQFE